MNTLIVAHQYYPVLGGVPVVARLLANGFLRSNVAVRLVTATRTPNHESDPFLVYRNPHPLLRLELFGWADQIVMIGPSVRSGWPTFFSRKPCVISHQAGLPSGWLQWALVRRARNIACSQYLASAIGRDVVAVPNPFDSSTFRICASVTKDREFIFVGRLVRDKGVDVLLRALANLHSRGMKARMSVVGAGHEEQKLKQLALDLDIGDSVDFTGALHGAELAAMIQSHHIGIVPSRWQEPFGIVALELIASGIPIIVSRVGGLPEAAGPCGLLFDNEDYQDLSRKMERLLLDRRLQVKLLSRTKAHLAPSSPENAAMSYLRVLASR